VHRTALQTFAAVESAPDEHGQAGRHVRPGDLVVLHPREAPRVRVALDIRQGSDGGKVIFFDPGASDCQRAFLASRVSTLPWPTVPAASLLALA